ncbi:MAG TPA: aminodeoxychorismate synthase component I [Chthoniobacterales bacterium]|jgi:aminodeoxychorismate synthase component I
MATPSPSFLSSAPLALELTPWEAAAGLRERAGFVFLDSVTEEAGQLSILAVEPEMILEGGDFSELEKEMEKRQRTASDHGWPVGAAIGFVTYEGRFCFGFYDDLLIYDHGQQRWFGSERLAGKVGEPVRSGRAKKLEFTGTTTAEEYCQQVEQAKEWIGAGDIYQVNVTHEFRARWSGAGFALFEALRHYSPAPYSAFLDLDRREIISSSPELFLKMSGRRIVTRPIKGTRPRGQEQERDELAAYELITSPKEVAELVMITDLERNDLGQICEYGSLRVTELLKLERYEQVFHLVSTVEGELRPEVSHVAALAACFPGGSITGAPKRRAREIIRELEGRERGVYTGAIGYLGYNGESQFSIAIRTVCKAGAEVSFGVGAGIVADSDAAREYQETLDKAAGILLAASRISSVNGSNAGPA